MEDNDVISLFPAEPIRPDDKDCCGNGCQVCVFDLYELDLKKWRIKVDNIKNKKKGDDFFQENVFSDLEFRAFVIVSMATLTRDLIYYEFEFESDKMMNLTVGQHLMTRIANTDKAPILRPDSPVIIRPYTPVIFNEKMSNRFAVYVQLYPVGTLSDYIRAHWKIGEYVDWRGPFGGFEYKPNTVGCLYLICGGTGIAPMLSIIQTILLNEDDETIINLLYSTKTACSVIAKEKLGEWKLYWNCNVTYFLTADNADRKAMSFGDDVILSRIDDIYLEKIISANKRKTSQKFLICGSSEFNNDMTKLVLKLNHNKIDELFCF